MRIFDDAGRYSLLDMLKDRDTRRDTTTRHDTKIPEIVIKN